MKIYIRQDFCIGCHLCEVYCQLRQAQTDDLTKAFKRGASRPLSRLRVDEGGIVSVSIRCQHCDEAPCMPVCPAGAITRNDTTGTVEVNPEKCFGCWTCILACPFGAIRRDTIQRKAVKCDLCAGEDIPLCVVNCPNGALVYAET